MVLYLCHGLGPKPASMVIWATPSAKRDTGGSEAACQMVKMIVIVSESQVQGPKGLNMWSHVVPKNAFFLTGTGKPGWEMNLGTP